MIGGRVAAATYHLRHHPRLPQTDRYQPAHVRVDALHYPGSKEELGEIPIPCIKLRDLWMEAAGYEVGARLKLEVSHGSIHLTVDQPPAPAMPKVRKMGRLQLARLHQTP